MTTAVTRSPDPAVGWSPPGRPGRRDRGRPRALPGGDRPLPLESDAALLLQFRRGETEALARVFREHLDDVAATLRAGVVVTAEGQRVRVGANLPEPEIEVLIQD